MASFLVLPLLLLSFSLPNCLSLPSDAFLLLQSIKPALQGSSSLENPHLSSWNASSLLCLWRGLLWSHSDGSPLRCDLPAVRSNFSLLSDPSLHLISLDLSSNLLSGSLPPSLWNLCRRLLFLRLHSNSLSGPIPSPTNPHSSCPSLAVLDLGSNSLSGPFPVFLSSFPSLADLDLSHNRLSGRLPDSISRLSRLHRLNLSFNTFSGKVPQSLGRNFPSASFEGNALQLSSDSSRLSAGAKAGIVIGSMAGAVVLASAAIGWAQRSRPRQEDCEMEDGGLMVFDGGEHLTPDDVLNAAGQVVEKTAYGTVYKAKMADGGNITLRLLREGTCRDLSSCLPAIRQLGRTRHENLVPLRAFYHGRKGEKLLIYDYLPNRRTLHELLHEGGETGTGRILLNWARRHKVALGAARGLAYLHGDFGAAHGAVRSSNIFVDESFTTRLADYGLGKIVISSVADEMAAGGYRAPELRGTKKCNSRTDVYAFGILLLEILIGKRPGKVDLPALVKAAVLEETAMEVFDAEVLKGMRGLTEEGVVRSLRLAMGCCAPVASARPDMSEVVRILEENRPRNRSALYSPADTASEIGTPF